MEEEIDNPLLDMSDEEAEAAFKEAKAELEQPDEDNSEEPSEDSNDDSNEEVEPDSETEEEPEDDNPAEEHEPETEEEEPSEDTETEEEQPEDNSFDDELNSYRWKVKAKGQDLEVGIEDLLAAYPRIVDYTQKMQAVSEYRKVNSAMSEHGITEADINLMVDVKKGNAEAIAEFMRKNSIDPLDVDTEKQGYTPTSYGVDDNVSMIRDIEARISSDAEYPKTYDILTKQWDDQSRQYFSDNPQAIEQLHVDVKSGTYDRVYAEALRRKIANGGHGSDLQFYLEAGRDMQAAEQQQEQHVTEQSGQYQEKRTAKTKARKRAASSPAKKKSVTPPPVDVMDMADDEFNKILEQMRG